MRAPFPHRSLIVTWLIHGVLLLALALILPLSAAQAHTEEWENLIINVGGGALVDGLRALLDAGANAALMIGTVGGVCVITAGLALGQISQKFLWWTVLAHLGLVPLALWYEHDLVARYLPTMASTAMDLVTGIISEAFVVWSAWRLRPTPAPAK